MKSCLALIFILLSTVIFAQFGPERIITTDLSGPNSIVVDDINGDLIPDVLLGTKFEPYDLGWKANLGNSTNFGDFQNITFGDSRNLTLADLDGDNDLDVVAAFIQEDKFIWFKNLDGLGNFSAAIIIESNINQPYQTIASDIDGDGDLDVVGAIEFTQTAVWYENLDGMGDFGPRQYVSIVQRGCRSVFAADIDGDGDIDVVANSAGNPTITWSENIDGLGTFGEPNIVAGQAAYVSTVFCADFDGDGDMDIMGAIPGDARVAWHENLDGLGSFGPQRIVTNLAISCLNVFCTDLDNDGDIDVLYTSTPSTNIENSEVAWSENLDGLGNFGPKQVIGNQLQYAYQVTAADIDNDGDMDVFAASQNNDKFVWYENLTVLGIVENNVKNIKIYPNPSSDTINFNSQNEIINSIAIYDVLGHKLIYENGDIKELDISNLPVGLYFVTIKTNIGKSVQKLLKH